MKSITYRGTTEMLIPTCRDGGTRQMHFSCGVETGSNASGPVHLGAKCCRQRNRDERVRIAQLHFSLFHERRSGER